MKLLIISDSHDHISNLKVVMEIAKKSKVERVVHCGDWSSVEAVKTVLSFGLPLYTVLGNADIDPELETYLKFNTKKFAPDFLKVEIDGRKIGITHRVKKDDERFNELDMVFSGHHHSKEERLINFQKFVRPGAIINGINFAVYDTVSNRIEFVNET